MKFRKGQRVFMVYEHPSQPSIRREGTVDSDEIDGWDYVDVRFDDFPKMVQPVLGYYLFSVEHSDH